MKKIVILLSLVLFITNCSSTSYIAPIKNRKEGVDKVFYKGKEDAISFEKNSTLAFSGKEKKGEIIVWVLFKNLSDHRINFFPKMITVYGVEENGELEPLETYNPNDYLDKIRRKQALALALQGLGNAFENMDAGQSNSSGTIYGSDGTTYTYTATTKDEEERQEAIEEDQRKLNRQARQNRLLRSSVKQGLLLKTTTFPGSYIAGNVIINHKSYDKYVLVLPIGNQKHIVQFRLVKK